VSGRNYRSAKAVSELTANVIGRSYEILWIPAFAGMSGRSGNADQQTPLIPAHSRPKDGVLSHVYAGIQSAAARPKYWSWIPAFAGMSGRSGNADQTHSAHSRV